jgi:hypothetical protein
MRAGKDCNIVWLRAVPSNNDMEPTVKTVMPFAKKRAKGLPLSPVAHARR